MKNWTLKELEQWQQAGTIKSFQVISKQAEPWKDKRSKYSAKRVEFDGIIFDSKKEAGRYMQLKMMQKAGMISNLERQVPFELNPGGTHSLIYKADFVYTDDAGKIIVEDVKGYRTKEYKKKRRLMLEVHKIVIKEM